MANTVIRKIEAAAKERIAEEDEYSRDYFRLDAPIILNYVLEKAHSKEDIIPLALELRESKEARAFREQLTLLDIASSLDDRNTLRQIRDEMIDKVKLLGKKIEQPTFDMDIGFPLSAALSVGQIARLVQNQIMRRRKRHLLFIEKLYNTGIQSRSVQRHLGKFLG